MPKYVTQEEVFQILTELNDPFGAKVRTTEAMRRISAIPAADVAPVRHGRWVVKGDAQPMSNDKVYGCSLCDDTRRYYAWQ